jgi:hypothetical protein
MSKLIPPPPPLPMPDLAARIDALRADLETFINAKVAELKLDCPGLPLQTIKNTIVKGNCECRSYLDLVAKDPA